MQCPLFLKKNIIHKMCLVLAPIFLNSSLLI